MLSQGREAPWDSQVPPCCSRGPNRVLRVQGRVPASQEGPPDPLPNTGCPMGLESRAETPGVVNRLCRDEHKGLRG